MQQLKFKVKIIAFWLFLKNTYAATSSNFPSFSICFL